MFKAPLKLFITPDIEAPTLPTRNSDICVGSPILLATSSCQTYKFLHKVGVQLCRRLTRTMPCENQKLFQPHNNHFKFPVYI